MSNDSVGFLASGQNPSYFNRYAYAGNNPMNVIDPTGKSGCAANASIGVGNSCTEYSGDLGGTEAENGGAQEGTTGATVGAIAGATVGVAASAVCDGATFGACVIGNPAIIVGAAAAGAAIGVGIERAYGQLGALVAKATAAGPQESQHALVAEYDGLYPDVRNGTTYLQAGDVWKYGTTNNAAGRYTGSFLRNTGLRMDIQNVGTRSATLVHEKVKLINYVVRNRSLPPGNKIFK